MERRQIIRVRRGENEALVVAPIPVMPDPLGRMRETKETCASMTILFFRAPGRRSRKRAVPLTSRDDFPPQAGEGENSVPSIKIARCHEDQQRFVRRAAVAALPYANIVEGLEDLVGRHHRVKGEGVKAEG